MAECILPNSKVLLGVFFVTFAIAGRAQTSSLKLLPGAELIVPVLQPGTPAQDPVAQEPPTKINPWESELHIDVLKGSGAVNVLKKKTAATPVVEVKDRNNTPVPGVMVFFSSPSSGPSVTFLNGERMFSTVTDSRGRAAASGLKPVNVGSFNVEVSVSDKTGTATADIPMSNYSKSGDAAGGKVASSGGLSHGTIGILVAVGAAAAIGAALGLSSHGGSSSSGSSSSTSTTATVTVGSGGTVSAPH